MPQDPIFWGQITPRSRNGEGKAHLQGLVSWEGISKTLKDGRNLETSKIIFSYNLGTSDPERAKGWSRVPQKLGMSQESTWCPVLTPTSLVQPTHANTET